MVRKEGVRIGILGILWVALLLPWLNLVMKAMFFYAECKPRSMVDNQPLGLPVRSLKPRVKNRDSFEFVARSEFGLGSKGYFNSSEFGCYKFRTEVQ